MNSRQILFTSFLFFCLLTSVLAQAPQAKRVTQQSQSVAITKATRLADLPLLAQSDISAVLGEENGSYHAEPAGNGYHITNAAQDLGAKWNTTGISLQANGTRWQLHLTTWGYGDNRRSVSAALPQARGNRVEYPRGTMTEWYVNGPLGVEQGFTLENPPGANPTEEPLTLELEQSGDVRTVVNRDELILVKDDGTPVLHYGGLAAYDAAGHTLPAWLETRGNKVLLQVADAGAKYPIVVDPFIQQAKLTASNATTGSYFGYSLSMSNDGNTIVVGAYGTGSGAAYVFTKPSGGWGNITETAKLTASDGASGDRFGWSVAINSDGNTVVVGASVASNQGIAYVFAKPGANWSSMTQTAKLTPSDGAPFMDFGDSVAISSDGNTVVVGATAAKIGANDAQGAAYMFVKPGVNWANAIEAAKLTASDGAPNNLFGSSVAISGDGNTALVGAIYANSNHGAAYLFAKPGSSWASMHENSKLTASDGASGNFFGASVAFSGDGNTIVVGAVYANNQGAAYVFVKPGSSWTTTTQTAKLTASDSTGGDEFGTSVAVSSDGNTIVVGAVYAHQNGTAYVYLKPVSGWSTKTESAKLVYVVGSSSWGEAVAVSGNTVVIGAITNSGGAAYIFAKATQSLYLPLVIR